MKQMERWEELYSNGALSIRQYAEWLIREGKLPKNLNYCSKEATEAVMKYREKNRIKDTTQCFDYLGEPLDNQLIEAQAFFNRISSLIIGKPIKQIICKHFDLRKEDCDKDFMEYWKEINEKRRQWGRPQNTIATVMWFGDNIILEVGEQQIEFNLWAPWSFEIKLNSFLMRETFNVEGKTVKEVAENPDYKDISCLYGNELIGQRITNIRFITDENDIVEFVLELSNGNELHLYEDTDEPTAELYIKDKE